MDLPALKRMCNAKAWKAFAAAADTDDYRSFVEHQTRADLEEASGCMAPVTWSTPTLDTFANEYNMRGEKIVAVDTVYRLNDKYFGQWLALHIPFRSCAELEDAEVEPAVEALHPFLAAAGRLATLLAALRWMARYPEAV